MQTTFKPMSGIHFTFRSLGSALDAAEELATNAYLREFGSATSHVSRLPDALSGETQARKRPAGIVTAFGVAGREGHCLSLLVWADKYEEGRATEFFFSLPYPRVP